MNKTYLDSSGLEHVIERVNKKLTVIDVMPTAGSEYLDKRCLYVGTDTAELIKGGIYECQEVADTSPQEYEWVLISSADVDLTKYLPAWEGTEEEWEALTDEEKENYVVLHITDDEEADDLTIDEISMTSAKPVSSRGIYDTFRFANAYTVWKDDSTSSLDRKETPLGREAKPGEYTFSYTIAPKTNSYLSSLYFKVVNTTDGSIVLSKQVPSNLIIGENDELIYYIVFIKNDTLNTVTPVLCAEGDATHKGVSSDMIFENIPIGISQEMLAQMAPMYSAMDGQFVDGYGVIYLEVT